MDSTHVPSTFEDISILNEIKSENNLPRVYFMVSDGEPADRYLRWDQLLILKIFNCQSKNVCRRSSWFSWAALLEKYSDYDGKGVFIFLEEETKPRLSKALKKGIQIATHAIGDHGNRVVLDWYEEALLTLKKIKSS